MRNETDAVSFDDCPHGHPTPTACPKCQEIRRIVQTPVRDYDPRRRATPLSKPPGRDDDDHADDDDGLLTRKERRARWREAQHDEAGHGGPAGTVEYMRIRGTRRIQVYRNWVDRKWGKDGATISRREARDLQRRGARVVRTVGISRPDSPMARLFGGLLSAIFKLGVTERHGLLRGEWAHNLAWARRRLRAAGARVPKKETAIRTTAIFRELVRGLPACRACHTPILVGCRLHGEQITRRRVYCDDACKMWAVRHPRRRRTPSRRAGDIRPAVHERFGAVMRRADALR